MMQKVLRAIHLACAQPQLLCVLDLFLRVCGAIVTLCLFDMINKASEYSHMIELYLIALF